MFGKGIMEIKQNDFDYYDSITLSGIQNNHKKKLPNEPLVQGNG